MVPDSRARRPVAYLRRHLEMWGFLFYWNCLHIYRRPELLSFSNGMAVSEQVMARETRTKNKDEDEGFLFFLFFNL